QGLQQGHLRDQAPRRPEAVVQDHQVRQGPYRTWKVAVLASAIAAGIVVALAGCGLGAGKGTSEVTLTVTRNLGTGSVGSLSRSKLAGSPTLVRPPYPSLQCP